MTDLGNDHPDALPDFDYHPPGHEAQGWPIIPAHRAIGVNVMENVETGESMEVLILPHLTFHFREVNGVRRGYSLLTSPAYARSTVRQAPEAAEHITNCDCPKHKNLIVTVHDPDTYYG